MWPCFPVPRECPAETVLINIIKMIIPACICKPFFRPVIMDFTYHIPGYLSMRQRYGLFSVRKQIPRKSFYIVHVVFRKGKTIQVCHYFPGSGGAATCGPDGLRIKQFWRALIKLRSSRTEVSGSGIKNQVPLCHGNIRMLTRCHYLSEYVPVTV